MSFQLSNEIAFVHDITEARRVSDIWRFSLDATPDSEKVSEANRRLRSIVNSLGALLSRKDFAVEVLNAHRMRRAAGSPAALSLANLMREAGELVTLGRLFNYGTVAELDEALGLLKLRDEDRGVLINLYRQNEPVKRSIRYALYLNMYNEPGILDDVEVNVDINREVLHAKVQLFDPEGQTLGSFVHSTHGTIAALADIIESVIDQAERYIKVGRITVDDPLVAALADSVIELRAVLESYDWLHTARGQSDEGNSSQG